MSGCASETEITGHFLLGCSFFIINRQKLLNGFFNIDLSLKNLKDELPLDIIALIWFWQK